MMSEVKSFASIGSQAMLRILVLNIALAIMGFWFLEAEDFQCAVSRK